MKALKLIFALFLIQNVAMGQIKEYNFPKYPDSTAQQIKLNRIAADLVGKEHRSEWLFLRDHLEFSSITEIEEITPVSIEQKDGRYLVSINIISHDYSKPENKTLSKFLIEYIDARKGLIFNSAKLLKLKKMNPGFF
jgi:hypothetical protein